MGQAKLILTCSLDGSRDCAAVQGLLEQYGLHADGAAGELTAKGELPSVFALMQSIDIASHLAARIEDAAPGTRVMSIKVTLLG